MGLVQGGRRGTAVRVGDLTKFADGKKYGAADGNRYELVDGKHYEAEDGAIHGEPGAS